MKGICVTLNTCCNAWTSYTIQTNISMKSAAVQFVDQGSIPAPSS